MQVFCAKIENVKGFFIKFEKHFQNFIKTTAKNAQK